MVEARRSMNTSTGAAGTVSSTGAAPGNGFSKRRKCSLPSLTSMTVAAMRGTTVSPAVGSARYARARAATPAWSSTA